MIWKIFLFHAASALMNGYDGWFPGSEGFGYEIDEEAGTITFVLEDLSQMEYYLGIGWNNYTHDESFHTKTMTNAELMIWDGGSINEGEAYNGSIWTYFGDKFIGRASYSPEAMTYWKRTPGSAHADGKPRWSRTLKRPDGCDKCIEIKKNQVYWVMSARGSIFDGRGNIEIQKNDPVEKEAWEGPRAGFHYAKTSREKVILWKTQDFDDLNQMTNHEKGWNQRVSKIGNKDLTDIPQNSAHIFAINLFFFLGISLF